MRVLAYDFAPLGSLHDIIHGHPLIRSAAILLPPKLTPFCRSPFPCRQKGEGAVESRPIAGVDSESEDCSGGRKRDGVPPREMLPPRHPQRHQVLQRPPLRRLRCQGGGLQPLQPGARPGQQAALHAGVGHIRVPCARVSGWVGGFGWVRGNTCGDMRLHVMDGG